MLERFKHFELFFTGQRCTADLAVNLARFQCPPNVPINIYVISLLPFLVPKTLSTHSQKWIKRHEVAVDQAPNVFVISGSKNMESYQNAWKMVRLRLSSLASFKTCLT